MSNQSTFWPEDSPVKTSARPAKELASSGSALDCGKNLLVWSQSYGLDLSLLKTFPPFAIEGLPWSFAISGRSGMTRSGIAFRLAPLALLTREIVSGSWPTLRACSGKRSSGANRSELYDAMMLTLRATDGDRGGRGDLIQAIRGNENKHFRYRTLTVRDAQIAGGASDPERRKAQGHSVGLHDQLWYEAKRLPTLTARDWKSGSASEATLSKNSRPLSEVVRNMPTLTANRWSGLQSHGENVLLGPLNPEWCEWYMGFPPNWTSLED